MKIIQLDRIKEILPSISLIPLNEKGFAAYSRGGAVIPPVGELLFDRGEIYRAVQAGAISPDKPVEPGDSISAKKQGRTSPHQITVADLTGVAAQDICIAQAVYEVFDKSTNAP